MRISKPLINSVLLFTIPSVIAYPQSEIPAIDIHTETVSSEIESTDSHEQKDQFFSYDDFLDLLEELEEGELEKRCGPEDLERINHFLAVLAKHGILPNEINEECVLENDIQELLYSTPSSYEYTYSLYQDDEYVIVPAIFHGQGEVVLCKGWVKKKWEQTKKFVKKHKKAIIIGAAVVVAATVVICVVIASSASAAAVAGAAGAAGASSSQSSKNEEADSTSQPESPTLKTVLDEHISSFKEIIVEDALIQPENVNDPSFGEKARDLGAFLAHETLDGISQIASVVPQLAEEIKGFGEMALPNSMKMPNDGHASPIEKYENLMAAGHQKIDQVFSTDQADRYTPEAKANSPTKDFTIGMVPPPGSLGCGSAAMDTGRIAATQATNIRGWSVGEPIQNRTVFGTIPKWSTVRRRYWKNRAEWAKSNPHNYGNNIPRMEKGLAPQRLNYETGKMESMELHHNPAQKDGGLFDFVEVWPDEHAVLDQNRYIGR